MAASRNSLSADSPDRVAASVAAFFAPRLAHRRRVVVALSGGRDSVALLHALADLRAAASPAAVSPVSAASVAAPPPLRFPASQSPQSPLSPPLQIPAFELSALHVHHGLSANADAWADFCADLCRRLDVPLRIARVRVADARGEGVEAAARRVRYAAFAEVEADWLALAHHRDDQAETLLLNLLRGAGAHGLAAMPEERPLRAGAPDEAPRLVRPLLTVSRREIEGWLDARGLAWIDDESNADERLRRNFLRNDILPRLAAVFPEPSAALVRAAGHLAGSAALADAVAAEDAALVVDGESLRLSAFNALPMARRANLLRRELHRRERRMPDARHLAEILRQLASVCGDAAPRFVVDGGELRVEHGRLLLSATRLPEPPPSLPWQGEDELPWAGGVLRFIDGTGLGLSRARLAGAGVCIRHRVGGERLQTHPKRPRRALKKLLQESDAPAPVRPLLPLLYCGEELAWVAGIGVDAAFVAEPDEAGVLPVWEPPLPVRP
ncbi:MAG: tRNA lysidine(34) synthetase TilS [Azospira sp.]|jgi:tRNA(Ile)-lysidine synthase|nr:tRNA lysidine(34) synthetase TilS [Azospira sp.]